MMKKERKKEKKLRTTNNLCTEKKMSAARLAMNCFYKCNEFKRKHWPLTL